MLTIDDNGKIQLSIDHLLGEYSYTFDDIIDKYTALKLNLFYHVVSSPSCRYEKGFGKERVPASITKMHEKERFKSILKAKHINGNPKGYFVNKHKSSLSASQINEIKSVSFTLCDNENLTKHFDARASSYCICFFHDFLEQCGIQPVVYLNDHDDTEQQQIVFNSPHLVEIFSRAYDMRWEHEWRIKNKLEFSNCDVAFLVVPDAEYENFTHWMWNSGDIDDDYIVLPSSIFTDAVDYLFILPKLEHNSWNQICLFDGPKMNFDEFLKPTSNDRQKLISAAENQLACLCKADIQECYEHKFTQRFFSFVGELDDSTKQLPIFSKYENIKKNSNEPWACSRDIIISLYEKIFRIQENRIIANRQ